MGFFSSFFQNTQTLRQMAQNVETNFARAKSELADLKSSLNQFTEFTQPEQLTSPSQLEGVQWNGLRRVKTAQPILAASEGLITSIEKELRNSLKDHRGKKIMSPEEDKIVSEATTLLEAFGTGNKSLSEKIERQNKNMQILRNNLNSLTSEKHGLWTTVKELEEFVDDILKGLAILDEDFKEFRQKLDAAEIF